MASALVNNAGVSPADGFLDFSPGGASTASAFSWLSPARVSSLGGRERDRDRDNKDRDYKQQQQQRLVSPVSATSGKKAAVAELKASSPVEGNGGSSTTSSGPSASPCVPVDDVAVSEADDFEFRLGDPVGGMLSADELFADGKLVPLRVATAASSSLPATSTTNIVNNNSINDNPENVETEVPEKAAEALESVGSGDLSVSISPRAPKCSSRSWKELLRFKKAAQNAKLDQVQKAAAASTPSGASHPATSRNSIPSGNNTISNSNNLRSLRHFLHRNNPNKLFSSSDAGSGSATLTLPLLRGDQRDLDSSSSDSLSLPARLSLSSSSASSAADHDDLPRLSLDADRPASRNSQPPRLWLSRPHHTGTSTVEVSRIGRSPGRRGTEAVPTPRCASVDSPRMNSSGKVVFQNLGRSSSSPSSIGGGGGGMRGKGGGRGGVDRSYSTNVRITPVLNVPVCSLKSGSVFGLFSPQKRTDRADHHGSAGGSRSSRGGGNGGVGGGSSNGNGSSGVNRSLT